MSEKQIYIENSSGVFEAAVYVPDGGRRHGGVVICHPHPQFGGDMYNNVVFAVQEAAAEEGLATLRFNFRGVGRSSGSIAGPEGDIADLIGIIEEFRGFDGVDRDKVALAGYSYGAMVALSAIRAGAAVPAVVAISPHVAIHPIDFLAQISSPLLLITGDKDALCPQSKIKGMLPSGANMEVIRGADHFYGGYENEAGRFAAAFLKEKIVQT